MRSVLLAASQNDWLRKNATRYEFLRRSVARFMPGETTQEAIEAAEKLRAAGFRVLLTKLGEDIERRQEADAVTEHYLDVLARIRDSPSICISIKLTQLGLNVDREIAWENLRRLTEFAGGRNWVWIDMESSNYVDVTLALYRRARELSEKTGLCVQAYLFRTDADVRALLPLRPAIRLVKGAYREPPDRAYPHKKDVDENFYRLARLLLDSDVLKTVIGTHDRALISRIEALVKSNDAVEFQMLYGIARDEQQRLRDEGRACGVLISYGEQWFPWYMRRLAERPANVLFVLRNLR